MNRYSNLIKYIPEGSFDYLEKWFLEFDIRIKITRNRKSKLGDYRKAKDNIHQITVNGTLLPELFFFVLTHELAHLHAFEKFGKKIMPHGAEWKTVFAEMLHDSMAVYSPDLRPIIERYSASPKANFLASPELVRYFRNPAMDASTTYIEDLMPGQQFIFRSQLFQMKAKIKKNYLCESVQSGRKFSFSPLAIIEKIEN